MNPLIIQNDFSQSELTALSLCPKKWFWQYGHMLKKRGMFNWHFALGEAWHSFLEHHHKGILRNDLEIFAPSIGEDVNRDAKFEEKLSFWKIVFPQYCIAYRKAWPLGKDSFRVEATEQIVTRSYRGVNFRGKIDIKGVKAFLPLVADNKTTYRLDIHGDKQMHHIFQFLFYFWLSGIEEGYFMANYMKKPAQRQGKKENALQFAARVAYEINDSPEDYFRRETVLYTKEEMRNFEKKILDPKVDKLLEMIYQTDEEVGLNPENHFTWTEQNLEACYNFNTPCAFMPLCFEDEALATIEYEQKTSKHEELETE